MTSADGQTFQSTGAFIVGDPSAPLCTIREDVRYDSFEVTVVDGALTGSATGSMPNPCGACGLRVPFTATLAGTHDATPPALFVQEPTPVSPLHPFFLIASEPLPANATARLVADDGTVERPAPLVARRGRPDDWGFSPGVGLRAGQGYAVALDGLVDFAGQAALPGLPLRLATFPAAPAVLEDGFESATGSALGGAAIMKATPLPSIAGSTSLYLGTQVAPALDALDARMLTVRLARQAGDSKLLFSFRVVASVAASQAMTGFSAQLWVGSGGAPVAGSLPNRWSVSTSPGETLMVAGQSMLMTPVAEAVMPLPADATGQVLFVIETNFPGCALPGAVGAGLLIDDLRLE